MKNKFLTKMSIIGAGTFINFVIGFATTPIITRLFEPAEYGIYSIFVLYGGFIAILLNLGFDQAIVRFYYDQDDTVYHGNLVRSCFRYPMLISVLFVLITCFFSVKGISLGYLRNNLMLAFSVYTIMMVFLRYDNAIFRVEYKSHKIALLNIMQKLIYVVSVFVFYVYSKSTSAYVLCYSAAIAVSFCVIIGTALEKDIWFVHQKKYDNIQIRELAEYSIPFMLTMGCSSLLHAIDRMVLSYYCSSYDVGVYSAALSIINVFTILQTSFTTIWMPKAVEKYEKNHENSAFFSVVSQTIIQVMLSLGIIVLILKDYIVLLLGSKYRGAICVIPFLTFYPIMYTASETTVVGLVFAKRSRLQMIPAVFACVSNLIGNIIMIPRYGIRGAAISTGISYIFFFVVRTVLAKKYYEVDYGKKRTIVFVSLYFLYSILNTFWCYKISNLIFGLSLLVAINIFYGNPIEKIKKVS